MRILHISPYYPPDHWGGIEIHVYELTKFLSEKGHDISVIAGTPSSPKTWTENGVTVKTLPTFEVADFRPLFPRIENPIVSGLDQSFHEFDDIDLIHVHGQEYAIAFEAARLALRHKIPYILTIHHTGDALREYTLIRLLRWLLKKSAFRFTIMKAPGIIAVSHGALRYVKEFRTDGVQLIPNAIDCQRFDGAGRSSGDYVLFIGRLDALKGPELLVRVAPQILENVDTRFVMVGTGPQEAYLKHLVEELDLKDKFIFIQNVSYHDLPKIIEKCSLLVAPHNAGYSMLEAAAVGKPVVSAQLDWNCETLADAALYFEPGNLEQLARFVTQVLLDDHLARMLGARAKEFVHNNRDWRVLGPRVVDVYERVVKFAGDN